MISVLLPIRTVSEANRASHEHWRVRQKRAKEQRNLTALVMRAAFRSGRPTLPCVVTLTRIAPRRLDVDNCVGCFKHIIDQVAAEMGVDDRDERVEWRFGQRKGGVGEYRVEVRIEKREAA